MQELRDGTPRCWIVDWEICALAHSACAIGGRGLWPGLTLIHYRRASSARMIPTWPRATSADNAAWYRLLDLAGVCDTLVADADAVYHPAAPIWIGSPLFTRSVASKCLLSALSVFGLTRVAIDMTFIL